MLDLAVVCGFASPLQAEPAIRQQLVRTPFSPAALHKPAEPLARPPHPVGLPVGSACAGAKMAKDPYLCTPTPRLPRRRHGCVITARCAQHPEGAVRVSDVRARQAKLRQIILERKAKQEQQEAAEAEARAAKEWEDVIRTNISASARFSQKCSCGQVRLAQDELRLAEESGDAARIAQAKQDLARELEEAESAQAVAERERMEAEQAEAEAAKVSRWHLGCILPKSASNNRANRAGSAGSVSTTACWRLLSPAAAVSHLGAASQGSGWRCRG